MFTPTLVNGFQAANPAAVGDSTLIGFYLVYAAVAVGLVVFLARTLSAYGGIFLRNVFEDDEVAQAVNKLLVIGFYLLNLGYALMIYRLQSDYGSVVTAFNDLVSRLGILLLSLGVIHLLNITVFWKIRGAATPKATGTEMLSERLAAKEGNEAMAAYGPAPSAPGPLAPQSPAINP